MTRAELARAYWTGMRDGALLTLFWCAVAVIVALVAR